MSGDPLLRFIRDGEQCLEVIQTERGTIAPARPSLYDLLKVVEKNGPFLLVFSQLVALTISRRSVVAGLLLVAILFPPLFEMKLALSQEEESQCTFQGGNRGKGRRGRAGEEEAAGVTVKLARAVSPWR